MTLLQVVAGAQFGSEAKGHVTQDLLARHFGSGRQINVRVAGPNAGHTAYDACFGRKYPLRQVPVGAVHPDVELVIAAGSEIDTNVLLDEIDKLEEDGHSVRGRMVVDAQATILTRRHHDSEGLLPSRLGSTGKGIGAARADRIMRTAGIAGDDDTLRDELADRGIRLCDTQEWLRLAVQQNYAFCQVVVEGTQGYGLGLHAGFYPFCTSSDCRAIDFLAMAGINPWNHYIHDFQVWLVARVYPIRVAGNSGPLAGETTWEKLGLPEERTTVTQKVRRVGTWDGDLVRRAVRANGGAPSVRVALTMLDQAVPQIANVIDRSALIRDHDARAWLDMVELDSGTQVRYVATGPKSAVWL